MKNVLTNLYQKINSAHSYTTHNGRAKQGSAYPYVVYKLSPVDNTEKDRDDYDLEVSCWDKSESTSHVVAVELADKVRDALVNYRDVNEHQLLIVSRPSMGYIPDPDEEIKRYDVTANIKTYRRL